MYPIPRLQTTTLTLAQPNSVRISLLAMLLLIWIIAFPSSLSAQPTPDNTTEHDTPTTSQPPQGYVPAASEINAADLGGSDILLVQTSLPWDSNANTESLSGLGYAYDIVDMSTISSIDMFDYPVILIVNDQVQAFYDQYASQVETFTNYVANGGVLVFFASSDGWAGGTLKADLPGGVKITTPWYENYCYVADNTHAIVTGQLSEGQPLTDNDLYSNYCSHGYFSNLPAEAKVILKESNGYPTFVEYPLGNGRVLASTLTWEHNWYFHTGNDGYGSFGRIALDDIFLYAFSNSGVIDGIINVFPASISADGVSTANVTLAGVTPGHRVRLTSNRGNVDTFGQAVGTVDDQGRFVTTIRSSTAGTAILSASDLNTGQLFPAVSSVKFLAAGGNPAIPPNNGPISIVGVEEELPLVGSYPILTNSLLQQLLDDVLQNRLVVTVDWRGSTPGRVEVSVNGQILSFPANDQRVVINLNMGRLLRSGRNDLRIVAYNANNQSSQTLPYAPVGWEAPNWLLKLLQDSAAQPQNMQAMSIEAGTQQHFITDTVGIELKLTHPASLDFWFKLPPKSQFSKVDIPVGKFETTGVQTYARLRIPIASSGTAEFRAGAKYLNENERRRAAGHFWKGLSILDTQITGDAYVIGQAHFDLALFVLIPEKIQGGAELEVKVTKERSWLALLYLIGVPDPTPVLENLPFGLGDPVTKFVTDIAMGYITLSGKGGAEFTYQLSPERRFDSLDLLLGAGLEVGLKANVGVAKLKGFYGGEVNTKFLCLRNIAENSLETNGFCETIFKAGGNMEVSAFGWFQSEILAFPSLEKRWPESLLATSGVAIQPTYQLTTTGWQLIPHVATPGYAVFAADMSNEQIAISESATPTTVPSTLLVSNIYPYSDPSIAIKAAPNQSLLLWTHDETDKPLGQSHEIAFTFNDGKTWSKPLTIMDDNRLDSAPQVAWTSSGKGLAVWQRLDADLPENATLDASVTRNIEIATALFDPATKLWSAPLLLTDNNAIDSLPLLARSSDGKIIAVWRQNDAGLLSGTASQPDRIMTAFYTDSWSVPVVVAENIPGIVDLSVDIESNSAVIVYTTYRVPNGGSAPFLHLFTMGWNGTSWSAPTQQTNDEQNHTNPQVVYTTDKIPLVVWLAGPELRTLNLSNGNTTAQSLNGTVSAVSELRVEHDKNNNLVAVYTAANEFIDLYTSIFDQKHKLWSAPIPLTFGNSLEGNLAPAIADNGNLLLAYTATEIEGGLQQLQTVEGETPIAYSAPVEGQTNLMLLVHTIGQDLTLDASSLTSSQPIVSNGESVTVGGTVTNSGSLALDNVTLAFYDGDPSAGGILIGKKSLAIPLAAGAAAALNLQYNPPSNGGIRTLFAVADPDNSVAETNESNNKASIKAFGADLIMPSLNVAHWGGTDIDLVAQIANQGNSPSPATTLVIELATKDGAIQRTAPIPAMDAGGLVTATVPTEFGALATGIHTLTVTVNQLVNPLFAELVTSNNWVTTTLTIGPDLAVDSFNLRSTPLTDSSISFTATIHNMGISAIDKAEVAIYQRGDFNKASQITTLPVGKLQPGTSTVITGKATGPLGCGLYVMVDPGQVIAEMDESNNIAMLPAELGPCAQFYNQPTSGVASVTVHFTDTSIGDNGSWLWNFGDGSTSTEQEPTHQYSKAGVYTVTLTVGGANGKNTVAIPSAVRVYAPTQADFISTPNNGVVPYQVQFTDRSSGSIYSWFWEFGDGETSIERNPIHIYETPGVYTVNLTVVGMGGEDTRTYTDLIEVRPYGSPHSLVLTSSRDTLKAQSGEQAVIAAEVRDANGNLVPNQRVNFTTSHGNIAGSAVTNAQGKAIVLLTVGDQAAIAEITATVEDITGHINLEFVYIAQQTLMPSIHR